MGGCVIFARILDKGRAEIAGTAGECVHNSPMDRHWFRFAGIAPGALNAEISKGPGDGELLAWVPENGTPKREPRDIRQRSADHNERGPDGDVETPACLLESVSRLGKTREDIRAWFDRLDLDDHAGFGGQA